MKPLNIPAQRARDRAHAEHRQAVQQWQFVAAAGWVLFSVVAFLSSSHGVWRSDEAPKLAPVHVVTKAYVDKKGQWRSYDNGEKIDVEHWTTK